MKATTIIICFKDKQYSVPANVNEFNGIVLPNGTLLKVQGWFESLPPKPMRLVEVYTYPDFSLQKIAELHNAVIATEVEEVKETSTIDKIAAEAAIIGNAASQAVGAAVGAFKEGMEGSAIPGKVEEVVAKAGELKDQVTSDVLEVADEVAEKTSELKEQGRAALEKGKNILSSGLSSLAAKAGNLSEKLKGEKPADAPAPEEKKE